MGLKHQKHSSTLVEYVGLSITGLALLFSNSCSGSLILCIGYILDKGFEKDWILDWGFGDWEFFIYLFKFHCGFLN